MKKRFVLVLVTMIAISSIGMISLAEEESVVELNWSDVEEYVKMSGVKGDFVSFDEVAIKMWLPEELKEVELTDEDKEAGFIGYYETTEDVPDMEQKAVVSVTYNDLGIMDIPDLEEILTGMEGVSEIEEGIVNGLPSVSYKLKEQDSASMTFITDSGYVLEFTFMPISSEEAFTMMSFIMCSIMPEEAEYIESSAIPESVSSDTAQQNGELGFSEIETETEADRPTITEESIPDDAGNQIVGSDGDVLVERETDSEGQVIRESYFDLERKPVLAPEGYAAILFEYDKAGNVKSEKYYGVEGEPIIIPSGAHKVTRSFDSQERVISEHYFDVKERPILIDKGYASVEYKYDEAGNIISESYFDPTRKPVMSTSGYHKVTRTFDEQGRVSSEQYYDETGSPVLCKMGYARIEFGYDGGFSWAYFDVDGTPMELTLGLKYDDRLGVINEGYSDSIEPGAKFSADGIDVVCTGREESDFFKYMIGYDVTNHSEYTVSFDATNYMVNGYRFQDIVVDLGGSPVTPGNFSHMTTFVNDEEILMLQTDLIQEVSYRWIFSENYDWENPTIDIPITIRTSAYGIRDVQPDLLSKNVLFDKDGIKVSYVGTDMENSYDPILGFAIQNTTNNKLNFWTGTVAADHTMVDMAQDFVTLEPGEKGVLVMHSYYDYEENISHSFVGKNLEVYIYAIDEYWDQKNLGPFNFIINEDGTITNS